MCSESTFIQVHKGLTKVLTGTSLLIRATVTDSQKYAYVLGSIRRPLMAYRFQSDPAPGSGYHPDTDPILCSGYWSDFGLFNQSGSGWACSLKKKFTGPFRGNFANTRDQSRCRSRPVTRYETMSTWAHMCMLLWTNVQKIVNENTDSEAQVCARQKGNKGENADRNRETPRPRRI